MNDTISQIQSDSDMTSIHFQETLDMENISTKERVLLHGSPVADVGKVKYKIIFPEDPADANICDSCA